MRIFIFQSKQGNKETDEGDSQDALVETEKKKVPMKDLQKKITD